VGVRRISESTDHLDQHAVVSHDMESNPQGAGRSDGRQTRWSEGARQERWGGPRPLAQSSHFLVVLNGAAARVGRANLFRMLMSFDRFVDTPH
jgi:hypothetical protein